MKILFAASEAVPFAASGGLADVIGSLPIAINEKGHDCRVVIPLYKSINENFKEDLTFVTNLTVDVAWRKQYCGVFSTVKNGITYYFIDNEYYFDRDGLYGFYDDGERFIFFSRAILEMLREIDFKPDIINANDWQTALIPVYYQIFYKYQQGYNDIKNIFTIHNIQYQGQYGTEILNELMGIPLYHSGLLEFDGKINLMKGAIETADKITTVSPSYAWEILDPWYSYGLDRVLVTKQYKLKGILNGMLNFGSLVKDTIKKLGNKIVGGIKEFFGIKSPSRLMRDEVGKYVADGIGVGFEDEIDNVYKDMQRALDLETGKMTANVQSSGTYQMAMAGTPTFNLLDNSEHSTQLVVNGKVLAEVVNTENRNREVATS